MAVLPLNLHSFEHGGKPLPNRALLAPARVLLPLLRYPLGYEVVHPKGFVVRLAVLYLTPYVLWLLFGLVTGNTPAWEGREYFDLFLAASALMSALRFVRRAVGQHRGEEVHSAEAGYSFIARMLPLPVAFSEQLVVPLLLGWLGWLAVVNFSTDLGLLLVVGSVSYFVLANWEWRNQMAQRRAPVDDKLRAHGYAANIDQHESLVSKVRRKQGGASASLNAVDAPPDIAELGGGRRGK